MGTARVYAALRIDAEIRETSEQLFERNRRLEPGCGGADAEMRAVAEREMTPELSTRNKLVGVRAELALVAAG